jgi:serine protease Do
MIAFFRPILAMCLLLLTALPAAAQVQKTVPQTREQVTLSFAPLVKRVGPAVVNIYTKKVVQQRVASPLLNDPFFRRFFGDQIPGGTRKRVQNALGSGVIVDADGLIVTNNHVVSGSDEIRVVLADRREFDAEIVMADERTDLAVLRIDTEGKPLPYLEFADSDGVEVGDLVLAVGNPFGLSQTVTSGIVSSVARTTSGINDLDFFIQTDAAINPGNSGGALIDMHGRLIGVNTAIFSRSGGSIGIGFAIPGNIVKRVVESAVTGKALVRPWFGASGQPVTQDIAQSMGLDRPAGVLVNSVYPDGPAAKAGIEVGDIIYAINDKVIDDAGSLRFRMYTLPIGGTAEVEVYRDGKPRRVTLPLESPPEDPPRDETKLTGRSPLAGVIVLNLSPAVNEEFGIPLALRGVMVEKIETDAVARRFFRPGDVLQSVNGREIDRVDTLVSTLRESAEDSWQIKLLREGKQLSFVIH